MTARLAPTKATASRLRVIQGKRLRRPRAWGWMVTGLLAVALFFGPIVANTALDRTAIELDEIRHQIAIEQSRFDRLRLDVARLESPERIQPLAEQLGFLYPDPADIRTVTAAGVVVIERSDGQWTDIKSTLSASP